MFSSKVANSYIKFYFYALSNTIYAKIINLKRTSKILFVFIKQPVRFKSTTEF